MFEFKKVTLKSKKLNRDINLEAYNEITDDGEKIIILSTKSLQKAFEAIKEERGITDSIKSDVRFNERGKFVYASVEWNLKDSSGYDSTFVGEANELSLDSLIAKKYPKTTALNRAMAAGIISYLMLPGKVYSEAQITPSLANKDDSDDALNESIKDRSIKYIDAKTAEPAGVITNAPTLPEDVTIAPKAENETAKMAEPSEPSANTNAETAATETVKTTEAVSKETENHSETKPEENSTENVNVANEEMVKPEKEIEIAAETTTVIENNAASVDKSVDDNELPYNDEPEIKADTKTENAEKVEEKPVTPAPTPVTKEIESSVNDNTPFGITPIYADKTVGDIVQMYKAKDAKVTGLVKMLIAGKVKPANAQAAKVIEYLRKAVL